MPVDTSHTVEQIVDTLNASVRRAYDAPIEYRPDTDGPCDQQGRLEPTLGKMQTSFSELKIQNRARRFSVLQQMRATVLEIKAKNLTIKLKDMTNRNNPDEIGVLPIRYIPEEDHEFIDVGSVFFWNFGVEQFPNHQQRFSEFRVLRSPDWTQEEIDDIQQKAAIRYREFIGEDLNVCDASRSK